MNAAQNVKDLPVVCRVCTDTKPNYSAAAGILANAVAAFFEDPENERAYQEWLKEKETR